MSGSDEEAGRRDQPIASADADGANLVKRLKDNQPLCDTEERRAPPKDGWAEPENTNQTLEAS